MSLYKETLKYENENSSNEKFWRDWFNLEKEVYKTILENKTQKVEGTLNELAQTYNLTPMQFMMFMDGIKESLNQDLEDLNSYEPDSNVVLDIDFEKLLYNMHKAKASWLFNLEEWDNIFSKEKQQEIDDKYHYGRTIRKGPKIGRNDPCPCGSGKKYKKCCGRKGAQAAS